MKILLMLCVLLSYQTMLANKPQTATLSPKLKSMLEDRIHFGELIKYLSALYPGGIPNIHMHKFSYVTITDHLTDHFEEARTIVEKAHGKSALRKFDKYIGDSTSLSSVQEIVMQRVAQLFDDQLMSTFTTPNESMKYQDSVDKQAMEQLLAEGVLDEEQLEMFKAWRKSTERWR